MKLQYPIFFIKKKRWRIAKDSPPTTIPGYHLSVSVNGMLNKNILILRNWGGYSHRKPRLIKNYSG